MTLHERPETLAKWGQHYLVNQGILDKILDWLEPYKSNKSDEIVEIGPGAGALTARLLKDSYKVRAIEVDVRMRDFLGQEFSAEIQEEKLSLLPGDFLKIGLGADTIGSAKVCVGNLPYNVGTDIVFRCLDHAPQFKYMLFMLQKELVDRLNATIRTKAYGAASVRFQWRAKVLKTFTVKAGSFQPPPKVQSALLFLERRDDMESVLRKPEVSQLLNKIFHRRRKMLRGLFDELKEHDVSSKRPEELSPEDYNNLLFGPLRSHWSTE